MLTRLVSILLGVVVIAVVAVALALNSPFLPAFLQAPYVLRVEPANDAAEIPPTSPITITFSAPMERAQTENAFALTPPVPGNLAWRDDQTLVFSPDARLPVSRTLTLSVSPDARSWIQRPLQAQTISRFTTVARPFVVDSSPAPTAQFIYVPDRVTITFSRPMDLSLLDRLTVEPGPEHFSTSLEGAMLTVNGFFEPRRQYQITVPASAADAKYGVELGRALAWSFTAATQYPNFSILNRGRVLQFPANGPIAVPTQYTNVSRLEVALYRIPRAVFEENTTAPFETWYAFVPNGAPLKSMTIITNAELDKYTKQIIELDPLPPGTYYLQVTAPERVGDTQLLLVE